MQRKGGGKTVKQETEIQHIIDTYASTLFRTAFALLKNRDDAEDAVQETLLRYLRKAPEFASPTHEKAWLLRVIINLCKNHLTSCWFRRRTDLSVEIPALEAEERLLLEAVLKLPQSYRSVIHLHYYEGYSVNEISQLLQCPVSTVTTRLSRARKRLALLLKGEDLLV